MIAIKIKNKTENEMNVNEMSPMSNNLIYLDSSLGQYIAVTMIGGAVSQAAGGDFLEGAVAAAMVHLFNDAQAAAEQARLQKGSTAYQWWDAHDKAHGHIGDFFEGSGFGGSNKCNLFLDDVLEIGDVQPGWINGRPPLAQDWFNKTLNIDGYHIINPAIDGYELGDVISDGKHVGIYYPLNGAHATISASAETQTVVHNYWGFRPNSDPVVIRRAIP